MGKVRGEDGMKGKVGCKGVRSSRETKKSLREGTDLRDYVLTNISMPGIICLRFLPFFLISLRGMTGRSHHHAAPPSSLVLAEHAQSVVINLIQVKKKDNKQKEHLFSFSYPCGCSDQTYFGWLTAASIEFLFTKEMKSSLSSSVITFQHGCLFFLSFSKSDCLCYRNNTGLSRVLFIHLLLSTGKL